MMYTNGTLIDDYVALRLGEPGNLIPAISVEGMREETDKRRGEGVFDRVVAAMERLRREKVFFGISMTATRDNAEDLLSDEVIDFYFQEMGAFMAGFSNTCPSAGPSPSDCSPRRNSVSGCGADPGRCL